jgi:hypothetical protein
MGRISVMGMGFGLGLGWDWDGIDFGREEGRASKGGHAAPAYGGAAAAAFAVANATYSWG